MTEIQVYKPNYPSSAAGKAYWTWTYDSTYYTPQGTLCYKCNLIGTATFYIRDYGSGRDLNLYKNAGIHELGHCLGYTGHAPNSSDVMSSLNNTVTTLSINEKNHLLQIY